METVIGFDLESCSELDLADVGAHRYAMHESTDVLCACASTGLIWRPGMAPPVFPEGAIFEGYNVPNFDAILWYHILTPRYAWPWPGWSAFRCTMARAAYTNLPGTLAKAAEAMGSAPKDSEGHKLMLQLCKPARAIIASRDPWRLHTPENLNRLAAYCMQDVVAEQDLSARLPQLPVRETKVFAVDHAVNRRGVPVNRRLVESCIACAEGIALHYREKLATLTRGDVETETALPALKRWCRAQGFDIPDGKGSFDKAAVETYLDTPHCPEPVREALIIRQRLGRSSLSKFTRMREATCPDGRLRGMLQYYGAHQTGRWAGRIIQPQNLPRIKLKDYDMAIMAAMSGPDALMFYYGDDAMDTLAALIRACLCASPDHELTIGDYNAIECRVVAWLADETAILDAFRQGRCPYRMMATLVFGCTYEQVTGEQRQLGKVIILACGYGMGAAKFMTTAALPPYNITLTLERATEMVNLYRNTNTNIKRLWRTCDDAAKAAIRRPMLEQPAGRLVFKFDGKDLGMRLPSGRWLRYRCAHIGLKAVPWSDEPQPAIFFMGEDKNGNWTRQDTYGGKLLENASQAISRDVTADALVRTEERGLSPVLTVHDELVNENPIGALSASAMEAAMCEPESWSASLPLKAEAFVSPYYKK